MKKRWSEVATGDEVRVKGEVWTVTAREGDEVTMRHRTLGARTGTPNPAAEVEVIESGLSDEAKEAARAFARKAKEAGDAKRREQLERTEAALKAAAPARDEELEKLRAYAIRQGVHTTKAKGATLEELRSLVTEAHAKRVAADNGVPERKVEEVTIRLVLGATLIANLEKDSSRPQCPEVEVMDWQTMANHLHFFHDVYPGGDVPLEDLVDLHTDHHGDDLEKLAHDHSVPF